MQGNIGFIGGGVMGEAMVKGLLDKGMVTPERVIVVDVSPARRESLARQYRVNCAERVQDALSGTETVVLAIKPQNLGEVFAELHGALRPEQLLLSIVAGATLQTLTQGMGHPTVVRAMPNTPAQIGQGMSVWAATAPVSEAQKATARSILSALGEEVYVAEERYLDMATALSGSGPAYVFLVIEALMDAGVHIGMPRAMAERLVLQTVAGSGRFALESGAHPAELRNMVTSPGGTTTEALLRLEEGGLRALFIRAVQAAYEKSRALGQQGSSQ